MKTQITLLVEILFFLMELTSVYCGEGSGVKTIELENECLLVRVESTSSRLTVRDKRVDKEWIQSCLLNGIRFFDLDKKDDTLFWTIQVKDYAKPCQIQLKFSANNEIQLSIDSDRTTPLHRLYFPCAFESSKSDRIILPNGPGLSLPVYQLPEYLPTLYRFLSGSGLNMCFAGHYEEKMVETTTSQDDRRIVGGPGYMVIAVTPDDGLVEYKIRDNGYFGLSLVWTAQKGVFAYPRIVRYRFFEQSDHVTFARNYREYAKKSGLVVSFDEKIRRNPKLQKGLDLIVGAANIWYWERDKVRQAHEMQALGMTHLLFNTAGGAEAFKGYKSEAEEVTKLQAMDNIITSCYDIYKDLIAPNQLSELRYISSDWPVEAWPNDIVWSSNKGDIARGWQVYPKDPNKPMISCVSLCEAKAIPYARKRIGRELQTKPYLARFLDVTGTGTTECWHPDHPLTRTESKKARQDLLGLLGREFNLVCGTEDGNEFYVPTCDYFEGVMSYHSGRVPDAGRNMWVLLDKVPEKIETIQINEKYRIPLWELVFHDCVVSYWYWGDSNNKIPTIWWKKDLFNIITGTPPLYLFDRTAWTQYRDQFVDSYRSIQKAVEKTVRSVMIDHKYLSSDRSIQQTVFNNGTIITVNFGDSDWKMSDGYLLKGRSFRIL